MINGVGRREKKEKKKKARDVMNNIMKKNKKKERKCKNDVRKKIKKLRFNIHLILNPLIYIYIHTIHSFYLETTF